MEGLVSRRHIADALGGFPAAGAGSLPKGRNELAITRRRHDAGIHPRFRMVDSCAAEFAAATPYYYSTYEPGAVGIDHVPNLMEREADRTVVVGSGPIRIGQGIEFDYGCVRGKAVRELDVRHPITTTGDRLTDFDTSTGSVPTLTAEHVCRS